MNANTLREKLRRLRAGAQESWCQSCLRTDQRLLIHHIKPIEEGGDNSPSNLAVLCYSCHRLLHLFLRGIPNIGGDIIAESIRPRRRERFAATLPRRQEVMAL